MTTQHTPGRLKAHHDHGWLVISDTSVPAYVRETVSLLTAQHKELLTWLRWAAKLLPEDVRSSWQYEQAQAAIAKAEGAA